MRKIHYSIRLAIVLAIISGLYLCATFLSHAALQLPILCALLLTAISTERLWAFLDWMGPVLGTVNTKEQERMQQRIVEQELARSLRYGSPLVIAAIREKKRTSSHVVAQNLRNMDIVLRTSSDYLLVLMPNTKLQQARDALKRLTTVLPIKDVVMLDEKVLKATIDYQRTSISHSKKALTHQQIRRICTQVLEKKFTSIKSDTDAPGLSNIYELFESAIPETMQKSFTTI